MLYRDRYLNLLMLSHFHIPKFQRDANIHLMAFDVAFAATEVSLNLFQLFKCLFFCLYDYVRITTVYEFSCNQSMVEFCNGMFCVTAP